MYATLMPARKSGKLLCAALGIGALLALAACEDAGNEKLPAANTRKVTLVAFIGPGDAHPRWAGLKGGVERLLSGIGTIQPTYYALAETTPDAARQVVSDALTDNPSVVCVFIPNAECAHAAFAALAESSLLTIAVDCDPGDVSVYGRVTVDWPDAAEELGKALPDLTGEGSTYLLVHNRFASTVDNGLYERFQRGAERAAHAVRALREVPRSAEDAAQPDAQRKLVTDIVGLFPNAALLVTLDPEVWLTRSAGWFDDLLAQNPRLRIATLSTAPSLWPLLGAPARPGPFAALVGPLDGDVGYAAAKIALDTLVARRDVQTRRSVPCEIVTPATLADFAQRYAKSAGGLDVSAHLPKVPTTQP